MHHRFIILLVGWFFVAGCTSHTEAPASARVGPTSPNEVQPPPAPVNPTLQGEVPLAPERNDPTSKGRIIVKEVSGTVNLTANGTSTALAVNSPIPQNAKINTTANSSVALVFSNGVVIRLGADTELVVEEFRQEPFGGTFTVAELVEEPSPSQVRLALNRGELLGNVKRLRFDQGSSFTVQSPVGAAGVRGGHPAGFRMAFRPTGAGQASFSLSCTAGVVTFQPPPGVDGGVRPVLVPAGQEIAVTVKVTRNAQGKLTVEPAAPVQPKPVSPAKLP